MPRNRYIVGIVFLTFFVMSLLTNILGPIVPDIISSFKVSLAAAALLPFSFFIAYGVMSIPAGFLVERFGERSVTLVAFFAGTVGSRAWCQKESGEKEAKAIPYLKLSTPRHVLATAQPWEGNEFP